MRWTIPATAESAPWHPLARSWCSERGLIAGGVYLGSEAAPYGLGAGALLLLGAWGAWSHARELRGGVGDRPLSPERCREAVRALASFG